MAALGALAVVAVGCGGNSDKADVEQTVQTYLTAIADGDGKKACDRLTGDAKRNLTDKLAMSIPEFGATSCEDGVEAISKNLGADETGPLRDAKIQVTVNGSNATAKPERGTDKVQLRRVDGTWLISGGFRFPEENASPPKTDPEPEPPAVEKPVKKKPGLASVARQLRSSGYSVTSDEVGSDPGGLDALSVEVGDATGHIVLYDTPANAARASAGFEQLANEMPEQVKFQVVDRTLYYATVEAPAVLPPDALSRLTVASRP